MIRPAFICAALALVAGCEDPTKAILFDGMRYTGRLQADSEDKRSFVATAGPVSQGLEGAREAALYEGNVYCIRKYGRSDIDWALSPDAAANALSITDDLLTVKGRCAE
ncbi:MAG: hypothetical protein AAF891_10540 [Pseudomonadota bacterium]